jgi:GH24 family phage-related lysozyme (muramidase)
MLGIQNALRDGRTHDVPDLLRSMKRLWPDTKGLQRRRDAEAALFEEAINKGRYA